MSLKFGSSPTHPHIIISISYETFYFNHHLSGCSKVGEPGDPRLKVSVVVFLEELHIHYFKSVT